MNPLIKILLTFDILLAPSFITLLYYMGLLGIFLGGLSAIFAGKIIKGIMIVVVGTMLVRVGCEMWLVFFRMNEALQEIRKK